MKLKLVHYDNGKAIGCKQDEVWFIIKRPTNCSKDDPERYVFWDVKRKMPTESVCPSIAAFSSLDAANIDFNDIERYYRNNGGFSTLKEVTI